MCDITKLIISVNIHKLNPDFLRNDKEISLWKETTYKTEANNDEEVNSVVSSETRLLNFPIRNLVYVHICTVSTIIKVPIFTSNMWQFFPCTSILIKKFQNAFFSGIEIWFYRCNCTCL